MNINLNSTSSESQNGMILAYMEQGNTITQLQALTLFGCFRLASRISDLKRRGYNIASKWLTGDNGKRYKSYYIEPSEN